MLMQEINRKRWSRSSGREKQKEDLNGRARPPDYREYQLSQKEWMQYLIMGAGAAGLCAYTFYRSVLAFLFLLPVAFLYPVYKKKDLKKDDRDIDLQNFRRQIMKIQRGEISILPRCEWKLANNNFLLHGYYNYRHLVLIDEGNQLKLGVPGIYHEREARAAATFGFPEFIAEADVNVTLEPQERNENQQFGYWCRQVRRPPR